MVKTENTTKKIDLTTQKDLKHLNAVFCNQINRTIFLISVHIILYDYPQRHLNKKTQ